MAGVIAFLQALPQLIDLMNRLGTWMIKNDLIKWMSDLEVQIDKLEKAQTENEKLAAAQGVLNSMRTIGSA